MKLIFHLDLQQITFAFLTLFLSIDCISNKYENQVYDKTGKLSSDDVNRYASEIKTWEDIFTSIVTSCLSAEVQNDSSNTKLLIFEGETEFIFNYTQNSVWLLGQCDNTSILLYSTQQENCDIFQLVNKKKPLTTTHGKTESKYILNFMDHMLQLFFNSAAKGNDYLKRNWNSTVSSGCGISAGILAIPKSTRSFTQDDWGSSTPPQNLTTHNLTKHHGGGGLTNAVITIIGVLCGGSVLSFLLFFRRIRHCICMICGLCKDGERLLSDVG